MRHLGKTITPEKIAVECSVKYAKNNEFLILPEMVFLNSSLFILITRNFLLIFQDLMYSLNMFTLIKDDKDLLNKWMARVDKEVNHYKDDLGMFTLCFLNKLTVQEPDM